MPACMPQSNASRGSYAKLLMFIWKPVSIMHIKACLSIAKYVCVPSILLSIIVCAENIVWVLSSHKVGRQVLSSAKKCFDSAYMRSMAMLAVICRWLTKHGLQLKRELENRLNLSFILSFWYNVMSRKYIYEAYICSQSFCFFKNISPDNSELIMHR